MGFIFRILIAESFSILLTERCTAFDIVFPRSETVIGSFYAFTLFKLDFGQRF